MQIKIENKINDVSAVLRWSESHLHTHTSIVLR